MKAKFLGLETYKYTKQDGTVAEGGYLHVCSPESEETDDGRGNAVYGYLTDKIYIPRAIFNDSFIRKVCTIPFGRLVDLIYTKKFGSKYDCLTDIRMLPEGGDKE